MNKLNHDLESVFTIEFHNHDGDQVGAIVIERDKGMRFSGNVEESANIFFEHLKTKIDQYVLTNKE